MTTKPRTPTGEKGMANDPKDPTQRMPPPVQSGGVEDQKVRMQQHTGNHDKPGPEARGADERGGTRAGAENVEPVDKPGPGKDRAGG